MKNPFLIGGKIYLRPIELNDADFLYKGENDPVIREALFLAFPVNFINEERRVHQHIKSKESIVLTIVDRSNDSIIGQTAFFRIDYVSRSAIFYLAIHNQEYWSKGIGTEATQIMVDYAFSTLNLNRIQLHVCSENSPAIKVYERVGFEKEGVLRQAMYRNNAYNDFWVMGIIKKDWLPNQ